MKSRENINLTTAPANALVRLIVVLAITCAFASQALAQQTPADTIISNTATATYSDGTDTFDTSSNTVTVTVSKVAGLTITPDVTDGSGGTVVVGQTGVMFSFTVTNTGNFTDNVRFKQSGASVSVASGTATVTQAFIDINGNNTYQAGTDTDILGNGADVVSANLAQNASLSVIVYATIGANAPGTVIDVRLGDADDATPFDNEPIDSSAAEVSTEFATPVNGRREARGDRSVTVQNDAILNLLLTSPTGPGPVALGSNIQYDWQVCNTGGQTATSVTLANAPGGSDVGVFIFAPIPADTTLPAQVFPPGTLYSDSPLGDDPITTANWYAVPTGTTTRVAFNVGASLAGGNTCSATFSQTVTITAPNANNPITQQGIAYATNFLNQQITDMSAIYTTLLQAVGSVLNGPLNAPGAINTTTNDDFTNKSVNTGIAGVAPGGITTAPGVVNFTNTVQNTGNANDTYTLTVQSFPAGSTVRVTVGVTQTDVVLAGVATGNPITPLNIAFGANGNYSVEVTLPTGMTVLTGYDTLIRATSGNTPASTNDTIDRVYTGFIELVKTVTVVNGTGVGGATDPVPGAVLVYAIAYENVSSAGGGAGNVELTASNIVISEDGAAGGNNWAATTTMVLGPGLDPTDTSGGTITDGVTAGAVTAVTNFLKDTIASLAAQQSGVFTFRRMIN